MSAGGWSIRPVRPDDAPALRRMREEAGWDLEKVPAWIAASVAGERPTWVAELDGETVGMVSLELVDPDPEVADGRDVAAVTSLSVLASAGRRGLGRALTVFAEAAGTGPGSSRPDAQHPADERRGGRPLRRARVPALEAGGALLGTGGVPPQITRGVKLFGAVSIFAAPCQSPG